MRPQWGVYETNSVLCQRLSAGSREGNVCVVTIDSVVYHLHILRVTHCRQYLLVLKNTVKKIKKITNMLL